MSGLQAMGVVTTMHGPIHIKIILIIVKTFFTSMEICIVLVVLCVFSCLMCICCTFFFIYLDAGVLARSQYSEGPATGHLDTDFSWFPCA